MKKNFISFLLVMLSMTVLPQRVEVNTFLSGSFKRHFTYSIEGGFVDNLPRQFVAGTVSDYLVNGAKIIQGNPIAGTVPYSGKSATFNDSISIERMLLTDFVVPKQGGNALYAYGTGIYFPGGAGLSGYPFFAVYERKSMEVISMVYYNLLYPGVEVPRNTAATRIKYSENENAFYISGIMSDQVFADMNFDDIQFFMINLTSI
ncbi:MAG: hypothetical protein RBS23_08835 [Mariniphaga sp.]|jgi:hypothetical protein|nr:hypothetical protein [Mariniphaga sp.]